MFFLILPLVFSDSTPVLKTTNLSNFISGFADGLKSSSTITIPCITAYPQLEARIETFSEAVDQGEDFNTLLHLFQSLVNELTTFGQTCDFQNNINNVVTLLTTGEGLDVIFILVFTNYTFYSNTYSLFKIALANGLYYDAGMNLGILYFKLFS